MAYVFFYSDQRRSAYKSYIHVYAVANDNVHHHVHHLIVKVLIFIETAKFDITVTVVNTCHTTMLV